MERRTERDDDTGEKGKGLDNKSGLTVYARRVCIKSLQIRRAERRENCPECKRER